MNGLRLVEGVSWHFAERHAGLERGALLAKVQSPRQLGLLEVDGQGIRCTPRGYLLLDEILERLLPD